jgi:hypothetical protein
MLFQDAGRVASFSSYYIGMIWKMGVRAAEGGQHRRHQGIFGQRHRIPAIYAVLGLVETKIVSWAFRSTGDACRALHRFPMQILLEPRMKDALSWNPSVMDCDPGARKFRGTANCFRRRRPAIHAAYVGPLEFLSYEHANSHSLIKHLRYGPHEHKGI